MKEHQPELSEATVSDNGDTEIINSDSVTRQDFDEGRDSISEATDYEHEPCRDVR